MDLSVITVSWNCKAELLDCLDSVARHAYGGTQEVLVVDNASADGTVEAVRQRFPQVRILEAGANLGFARAANLGFRAAQGDYLLFLNPDTLMPAGTLDTALHALRSRPEVGILGARLLNADGSPQPSCGEFLSVAELVRAHVRRVLGGTLEKAGAGNLPLWESTTSEEVDWLIGAFMLCRRVVLTEVGGFDEDYFLYAEDMDLCYRVRQRGYTVWYCPEVMVTHHGNRSGARKWAERRAGEIVRAELIFLRKHRGRLAALGFRLLGGTLFLCKGLTAWLRAQRREEVSQIEARRYWHMIKVCLGWE